MRAAKWRAARYGLDGQLIDLETMGSVPAAAMVESLLSYVRPALENTANGTKSQRLREERSSVARPRGGSVRSSPETNGLRMSSTS